ncbi:MAG: hypothetical protein ACYCUE_08330 [Steroidobacteraceae bacterium]
MNERDIIRTQLATERIHAAQVANACASIYGAPGAAEAHTPFRDASVEYLVWVLSRFEQRDQLLAELIEHSAPGSAERADLPGELATLAGHTGTSRQALTRLEAALAAAAPTVGAAWQAFAQFFNTAWCPRREAIESQFAKLPRIAGWRAVCAIDADSILEERARYARVAAQLPPGVTLVGAGQR